VVPFQHGEHQQQQAGALRRAHDDERVVARHVKHDVRLRPGLEPDGWCRGRLLLLWHPEPAFGEDQTCLASGGGADDGPVQNVK
jgi:hypothetical protein